MSKSRAPLVIGLTAASGLGYYLYNAGGSPRAAEKRMEADAHRAAAKIKGEIPSKLSHPHHEGEREGTKIGREAGSKFDSAVSTVERDLSKAKSETEGYAKATKADTLKKIDEFDRKVEDKAAQSKSYLSSWFGGK